MVCFQSSSGIELAVCSFQLYVEFLNLFRNQETEVFILQRSRCSFRSNVGGNVCVKSEYGEGVGCVTRNDSDCDCRFAVCEVSKEPGGKKTSQTKDWLNEALMALFALTTLGNRIKAGQRRKGDSLNASQSGSPPTLDYINGYLHSNKSFSATRDTRSKNILTNGKADFLGCIQLVWTNWE